MARVNQARDAQALNFGIQSVTSALAAGYITGAFTSVATGPPQTATTNYTAGALNSLAGYIVIATSTSATWASANVLYGTVLSNTNGAASVLTMDGWWVYNTNAAGTIFATSLFVAIPAMSPFWVMGLTNNVSGTIAGTETGTAPGGTEYTANGLGRTIITTATHTASASTGTNGVTFTVSGSPGSITIGASFIANSLTASAGSGRGNFMFFDDELNGTTGYVVATAGDTLQVTYTITYTTVP